MAKQATMVRSFVRSLKYAPGAILCQAEYSAQRVPDRIAPRPFAFFKEVSP